eukprot:1924912-Amphidinium_carterae.1
MTRCATVAWLSTEMGGRNLKYIWHAIKDKQQVNVGDDGQLEAFSKCFCFKEQKGRQPWMQDDQMSSVRQVGSDVKDDLL